MRHDDYVTRTSQPAERFMRRDPVVHTKPNDRWNGPLGEGAVARADFLDVFRVDGDGLVLGVDLDLGHGS